MDIALAACLFACIFILPAAIIVIVAKPLWRRWGVVAAAASAAGLAASAIALLLGIGSP